MQLSARRLFWHLYALHAMSVIFPTVIVSQEAGPNKLIESLRYASFAEDALQCRSEAVQSPIKHAKRWTALAIKTVRAFRTKDKTEQGRAAAFLARQVKLLSELDTRDRNLDKTYTLATEDLKHARLVSAFGAVSQSEVPDCDSRFQSLRSRIADLKQQEESLISDGDARQISSPRTAKEYYERALRLNVEDITIKVKISSIANTIHASSNSRNNANRYNAPTRKEEGQSNPIPPDSSGTSVDNGFSDTGFYRGQSSGLLIWEGYVYGTKIVQIDGDRVSDGLLEGGLPGVACVIKPSDGQHVSVIVAPGPINHYGRLVLQVHGNGQVRVFLKWSLP